MRFTSDKDHYVSFGRCKLLIFLQKKQRVFDTGKPA